MLYDRLAEVAQLEERLPCKQDVRGSIPRYGTIYQEDFPGGHTAGDAPVTNRAICAA